MNGEQFFNMFHIRNLLYFAKYFKKKKTFKEKINYSHMKLSKRFHAFKINFSF